MAQASLSPHAEPPTANPWITFKRPAPFQILKIVIANVVCVILRFIGVDFIDPKTILVGRILYLGMQFLVAAGLWYLFLQVRNKADRDKKVKVKEATSKEDPAGAVVSSDPKLKRPFAAADMEPYSVDEVTYYWTLGAVFQGWKIQGFVGAMLQ